MLPLTPTCSPSSVLHVVRVGVPSKSPPLAWKMESMAVTAPSTFTPLPPPGLAATVLWRIVKRPQRPSPSPTPRDV